MRFTLEDLDKALKHKNICVSIYGDKNVVKHSSPTTVFKRHREITIKGIIYKIGWYINQCELKIGALTVLFNSVKQASTWPNSAKMNLQFYDKNRAVCCILRIE